MKRIVLTGPESTGKSQLCTELSQHFRCPMIPEIARDYLFKNGTQYTEKDVHEIARLQINAEASITDGKSEYVFIDTDLIVTKIWLRHCYKRVPAWIDESIANTPRHLHLLCYYDLPWVPDSLRENPSIRKELFDEYLSEITSFGFKYSVIKGIGELRLNSAIAAITSI